MIGRAFTSGAYLAAGLLLLASGGPAHSYAEGTLGFAADRNIILIDDDAETYARRTRPPRRGLTGLCSCHSVYGTPVARNVTTREGCLEIQNRYRGTVTCSFRGVRLPNSLQ